MYMRDFYEERKRSSLFSWRDFSKLAGFSSPNFMQLVCEGKSRLSKTGVEKVADAMGLAGADRDYFFAMERFGDARSDSMKLQAFNEMQKIAKENRLRVVDAEAFKYFESWVNPVLRELAPIMPGAKPLELARQCYPVVSAAEVLMECQTDNGSISLHINTFGFRSTLLGHLNHAFSLLVDSTNGTHTSQLGSAIHRPTEDVEEDKEKDEAREHHTHAHKRHSDAMRVLFLKLLNLVVVVSNVWSIRCYLVCLTHLPLTSAEA